MTRKYSTATFLVAMLAAGVALAQNEAGTAYPSKPIRYIVPYTPGGLGDTFSRVIAQHLSQKLGQPVVIDNRPGASQLIGARAAASSPPDGYAMFMGSQSGLVLNVAAYKDLGFDPVKDFAPVSLLFYTPLYLVAHSSLKAQTLKELISIAKANPGKVSFASIGTGTVGYLAGEMLRTMAGIDLLHVPYKGSTPAMTDLLAGHVQIMFEGGGSALPPVQSGKLRAIATTGPRRSEAMPELPTMSESGLPGFEVWAWFGLVVPAHTPRPIVERLNHEVVELLSSPSFKEKYSASLGVEMAPSTPEEFGDRIKADIPRWTKLARDAGILPE